MSYSVNPIKDRIRETAKKLKLSSAHRNLSSRVKELTEEVLSGWNAVVGGEGGRLGLESFGNVPHRNLNFNVGKDADPTLLMSKLHSLGMAPRHVESVTEQCMNLFDSSYSPETILRGNGNNADSYVDMSKVVGRSASTNVAGTDAQFALEAFGDDINRLSIDDRLTMDLMIMRPYDNIMDKGLARVADSSPVVTIKVPSPEVYDWAVTQLPNSTVQSRNYNNTYLLRDLYRNPTVVNSSPKPIVALVANDIKGVLFDASGTYYKTNVDVSLLDISRNAAVFTQTTIDRTDLIADGAVLNGVVFSITSGGVTEKFLVNSNAFTEARYVPSPNNRQSGQRQVLMEIIFPISATTVQYNGAPSTIAPLLTDAIVQVSVRVNSTLNLMTGALQASGSVNLTLLPLASGVAPSAATETLFGGMVGQFSAYSVTAAYDEENQRKANLGIWVNYRQEQFVVPRSRVFFTEYSLTQEIDENAVSATSSIVALGNGRRGLQIVVDSLNDVSTGLSFTSAYPELSAYNNIGEQSFAASLVMPYVVSTVMNFGTEEFAIMNESTRLSEIHGRFRARFLSMLTVLFAQSLMLNQYKPGEIPVIKAWVHSTIADLVIGIDDYHNDLNDKETTATGADYSMVLPNGYRLDIIKSNFDCLQQRIYAVPVIESDMTSVLSAAMIRDCGTVTTNYTPTNAGAVTRRIATTTREIVMMSNKVGLMLTIEGLELQLGTFGFSAMPLNADYTNTLVV